MYNARIPNTDECSFQRASNQHHFSTAPTSPQYCYEKQQRAGDLQHQQHIPQYNLKQVEEKQQRNGVMMHQQRPKQESTSKPLLASGESAQVWELAPKQSSLRFNNLFQLKWCTTWFCPPVVQECDELVTPILEAAVKTQAVVPLYSNHQYDTDDTDFEEEKKQDDYNDGKYVYPQRQLDSSSENKPPLSSVKPSIISRRSSAPSTTLTPRSGRPPRIVRNSSTPQQRLFSTVRQLQQQQNYRPRAETWSTKSSFLSNITETTAQQQQRPNRIRSDSSNTWSTRSSFHSAMTDGSRHRRDDARILSPTSLQSIVADEEPAAAEETMEDCKRYSVDTSVTRTIQDVTCALLDNDYLSPLDSDEEEDGTYRGRHPLDTPKSFGGRKRVSIKIGRSNSNSFLALSPRIQPQDYQDRKDFVFDSDDDDDSFMVDSMSRSRIAFSRRKRRNGSSCGSSSSESTTPRRIVDDQHDANQEAVYLPQCNYFEQEILKNHNSSHIVVSGWVAYSSSDSTLERFKTNKVRRRDLGYLIMLSDCSTLYFFPSNHDNKNKPPVQIELSANTMVDSQLVSPQHGNAVIVMDRVTRKPTCTIVPISFRQDYFLDQDLTCLSKKLKQAPPFCKSQPHLDDDSSLDEFAPFEQHEAVMHIRFALDSLIRRAV